MSATPIRRTGPTMALGTLALVLAMLAVHPPGLAAEEAAAGASDPPAPAAREGTVRVATLIYASGKASVCFADDFLDTVARETDVDVEREFQRVQLASDELFDYPFVVMTGEGAFTLTDVEKENLRTYIEQGGFLLASAGCSNAKWADSFRAVMDELYGKDAMKEIELGHPMFHSIHDIDRIVIRKDKGGPAALYGLSLNGTLRVVFSPQGLNDTGNAGKGCCCCGGNEVRNAKLINANILGYALTH